MTPTAIDPQDLLALPLFAGLEKEDFTGLDAHLTTEEYPRGHVLFQRGAPGDGLYVVLAGQVALEIPTDDHRELLSLCAPGDWFGELALLTAETRSADARVTVDARLLCISRAGWAMLGQRAPRVFARLCERLARNLRVMNEPRRATQRTVVACADPADSDVTWLPQLAANLCRQFPARAVHVLALDGTACSDASGPIVCPIDRPSLEQGVARVVAPDAVILLAGGTAEGLADRTLVRMTPTVWRLTPGRGGRANDLVRGNSAAAAIDRVARHLAGGTVGFALGAGGAFGYAHLGVLRALTSAGVPIDYVAGSSMGAIIGCAVAAGVPIERMTAFAERVSARYLRTVLQDLNLFGPTLIRGTAVMRLLAELEELRDARIESLDIPFVAIAMDLATGEQVVIDEGPALESIRPSFAMPGIFPPHPLGGRLMIDGAMVNPVPVDPARALGADFVIASHVVPPLLAEPADPIGALLGRAGRLADFVPLWRARNWVQTLDVSLRSFQALWYRLSAATALRADAAVRPNLEAYWFLQFGAAREIIAAGEACGVESMPGIRALLAERVGLRV